MRGDFATDWVRQHARPVALKARHQEASRLASKLLDSGAREALGREDIEEGLNAELELFEFQSVTTAMM